MYGGFKTGFKNRGYHFSSKRIWDSNDDDDNDDENEEDKYEGKHVGKDEDGKRRLYVAFTQVGCLLTIHVACISICTSLLRRHYILLALQKMRLWRVELRKEMKQSMFVAIDQPRYNRHTAWFKSFVVALVFMTNTFLKDNLICDNRNSPEWVSHSISCTLSWHLLNSI